MNSIRRALLALFMMLVLFSVLVGAQPVMAQEDAAVPAPEGAEEVLRAAEVARSAGDAEAFAAYYADDAVYVALPPPPGTTGVFVGRAMLQEISEELISRNFHVDFADFRVNGESATFTALLSEDNFTDVGVAPIEFAGTATVQDGMIVAETLIMRPESLARLIAAENKALVQRLYNEVYTGRAPDTLGKLAAPDAIDAYRASVAVTQATFPSLTATVDQLLVDGDQVVAIVTFAGTSAGGAPVSWTQVDIHRIADGLLAETIRSGGPALSVE